MKMKKSSVWRTNSARNVVCQRMVLQPRRKTMKIKKKTENPTVRKFSLKLEAGVDKFYPNGLPFDLGGLRFGLYKAVDLAFLSCQPACSRYPVSS